jgi:hypothetical protein
MTDISPHPPPLRREPDLTRHPLILDGLAVTFYLVFKEPAVFQGLSLARPPRIRLARPSPTATWAVFEEPSNLIEPSWHRQALSCSSVRFFAPCSAGVRNHPACTQQAGPDRIGHCQEGVSSRAIPAKRPGSREEPSNLRDPPPLCQPPAEDFLTGIFWPTFWRGPHSGPSTCWPKRGWPERYRPEPGWRPRSPCGEPVDYMGPSRGCQAVRTEKPAAPGPGRSGSTVSGLEFRGWGSGAGVPGAGIRGLGFGGRGFGGWGAPTFRSSGAGRT